MPPVTCLGVKLGRLSPKMSTTVDSAVLRPIGWQERTQTQGSVAQGSIGSIGVRIRQPCNACAALLRFSKVSPSTTPPPSSSAQSWAGSRCPPRPRAWVWVYISRGPLQVSLNPKPSSFGDHPIRLERYREESHGPRAKNDTQKQPPSLGCSPLHEQS